MLRWFILALLFAPLIVNAQTSPEPPASATQPITLEWIYQEAHKVRWGEPSAEKWAPNGSRLAYLIANTTEEPRLRLLNPATKQAHTILSPTRLAQKIDALAAKSDDGVQPSTRSVRIYGFSWLDDPERLRLNTSEGRFIYQLESQDLEEEILPGGQRHQTRFSPNRRYIAFTRDYDLYAHDFEQDREIRLTQGGSETLRNGRLDWVYPEELGIRDGFAWSPDNQHIAYLQMDQTGVSKYPLTNFDPQVPTLREMFFPKAGTQNPLVRVGVVSLSSRETHWINLGKPYEYIARFDWTPDGERLAIVALNREQDELALLFANPATGESQEILRERSEDWVNVLGSPIFYGEEKDFIWRSEREGYAHLYHYTHAGQTSRRLTHGPWVVTDVIDIDEEAQRVYFTATRQSPIERHIYSVSLRGGSIRQITEAPGTHSATLSADGKYLYRTYQNIHTPQRKQVLTNRGKAVYTLSARTQASYPVRLLTPELFTIEDEAGHTFHCRLIKPPNFDANKQYPVIFSIYGGPLVQLVRNTFGNFRDQWFAEQGFLVFAIDNRGSANRGHAWEAPLYRQMGKVELQDYLTGVEYLKTLPYVDSQRIGMFGWSYGGYITLYSMLHGEGAFRAGAAVAPVADWMLYDTIYTERYMDHPDDNPEGYRDSSPVHAAHQLEGDLLIAHGISDDNVHIQHVYEFIDALIEANQPYTFYAYPQKSHGIWGDNTRIHLFERMLEFFQTTLGEDQ